jgi:hypothetical protein
MSADGNSCAMVLFGDVTRRFRVQVARVLFQGREMTSIFAHGRWCHHGESPASNDAGAVGVAHD